MLFKQHNMTPVQSLSTILNFSISLRKLLLSLFILLTAFTAQAQKYEQKLPENTRILFLLDGSGSMLARWGGQTRMEVAKAILADLVDSLSTNQKVELALRVYGHQYPREKDNCQDTRLEVPFSKNNHSSIIAKLDGIKPKGNTPITYSLERAANDFPKDNTYRNIIILITDGIESCDGDPCKMSLALQRKNVFLKPFVIGIGADSNAAKQFDCIGEFISADNRKDLHKALARSITTTLNKTTVSIELMDDKNRKTVSNINVTFINNFTKQPAYEFIHYRDAIGRPDTVEIDGILTYDIVVNTVPAVFKHNVSIKSGEHNVIHIAAPEGGLELKQPGHTAYAKGVQVLVKDRKTGKIHNTQLVNEKHNYLVGKYDVEILTLPRVELKAVQIDYGKVKTINVDDPGLLNLKMTAPGYGSIYAVNSNGSEEWIYALSEVKSSDRIVLQPGSYKVVFRAKNAPGSKFTAVKSFTIKSGSSTNLTLFN